ncbi:MAG: hypothetical protein OXH86_07805 [Acidimicrobiaceae bacterium]|nr:hypothetical protein [Acidimicrobiaceae bacterium]
MAGTAATLEPAAAQPQAGADESDGAPSADGGPAGARTAAGHTADSRRRPLRTAGLVAVIVGLTGGVLGLAGLGFVTLRDDIRAIDAKIDTQVGLLRNELGAEIAQVRAEMNQGFAQVDARFAQVDARFAQVDARFAEMNAVLLDHGERLARIETGHGERLARIEAAHGVPPHP